MKHAHTLKYNSNGDENLCHKSIMVLWTWFVGYICGIHFHLHLYHIQFYSIYFVPEIHIWQYSLEL
jgi:hypothetical protein